MYFKDYLKEKGIKRTDKFNDCMILALDNLFKDNTFGYIFYPKEAKLIFIELIDADLDQLDALLNKIISYEKLYIFT